MVSSRSRNFAVLNLAVAMLFCGSGCRVHAQTPGRRDPSSSPGQAPAQKSGNSPEVQETEKDQDFQPDRPDVTNGTHIVPIGLLQVEFGGHYSRVTSTGRNFGWPIALRVGVFDWLEARVSADGFVGQSDTGTRANGIGNIQLGAKLRLWATPGGAPVLCVLPTVNFPIASAAKGLGTGQSDYTLALLTGSDFGERNHVDFNYGIGSISAGSGRHRFTQHLLSLSASRRFGERANPYCEAYWLSQDEPGGGRVVSTDFGLILNLNGRVALDGGLDVGLTRAAQRLTVFGGISIIIGDIMGSHGVHARQRRAQERISRRSPRRK